jgi:predicted homoserine dehydrogenase-like protein
MYGPVVPAGTPIEIAYKSYPEIPRAGIVDYVVGATPAPGVFVIASNVDTQQRAYLKYYKMGVGPAYVFHTPYHLCHFETQNSIARAVIFKDATLAPIGAPMVDVIAVAKRDLKAGEVLDGIGGFTVYGLCENSDVVRRENLLPIGLARGGVLNTDVPKDTVLTYDEVVTPTGRFSDHIRAEQNKQWSGQ